jgi:hypothetical protein
MPLKELWCDPPTRGQNHAPSLHGWSGSNPLSAPTAHAPPDWLPRRPAVRGGRTGVVLPRFDGSGPAASRRRTGGGMSDECPHRLNLSPRPARRAPPHHQRHARGRGRRSPWVVMSPPRILDRAGGRHIRVQCLFGSVDRTPEPRPDAPAQRGPRAGGTGGAALPTAAGPADHLHPTHAGAPGDAVRVSLRGRPVAAWPDTSARKG